MNQSAKRNLAKYLRYSLDRESFRPRFGTRLSPQSLSASALARGKHPEPSIIIHGIMPRSGTVFVGELLRLHPHVHAYPNDLWEVPFLQHANQLKSLQEDFLWAHEQNMGKIGDDDFLPLFGSSLIGFLRQYTPSDKRLLIKVPSVQYLSSFFDIFPFENLMVVIRDGRDIVHSTAKTWPIIRFWMICIRWRRAVRMLQACRRAFEIEKRRFWIGRFEDAVETPAIFVHEACEHLGLDPGEYPFSKVEDLPVRGSSSLHNSGNVTWYPMRPPADFRPIKHWESWGPIRKFLFKTIAGKELIDLGYAQDHNW